MEIEVVLSRFYKLSSVEHIDNVLTISYGVVYHNNVRSNYFIRKETRKYVVASRGRADRSSGRLGRRLREHSSVYRPTTFERFWGRLGLCSRVKVTLRVLNVY